MFLLWVTFIWRISQCVQKSGNEWQAGVDRRGFRIKQDFIPLFFFMYVYILWQGQKAVFTIVEFEFVDIFCSKFQLVSTFSICSKFCVDNWLLCWDLNCKWVTCRSGCKRFWKWALHISHHDLSEIRITTDTLSQDSSYPCLVLDKVISYFVTIEQISELRMIVIQ